MVDKNNRVFRYQNMYICDGSIISADPGVTPSLTITALTKRAMSKISKKSRYA
jgi:cholesterol oxidase